MKKMFNSNFKFKNQSVFIWLKMNRKRFFGFSSIMLLVFINVFSVFSQSQITRDLKCTYVANSFGGHKWVQNFIENISVTKDGTVYTNSYWDEAHRPYGIYTKCDVIGNANRNPNSLVATDCNGKTWTIINPYLRFMHSKVAPVPTGALAPYIQCSDGREIRSIVDPTAIAIDNQCRLMVADNGPDQNITVFDISGTGTPVVLQTIGDKGGALSGPNPGKIEPLKFWGIRGIGTDSIGNLWVANSGFPSQVGGGTDLRHFDTNLNMDCQLLGLAFVQSMDADPLNPTHIYSSGERYEVDYDAPAGDLQAHWKYAAQTLDPFNYPDDPRLLNSLESTFIRYIDGKKFMFLTNMYTEFVCVYRFDGEIAVPCAFFCADWNGQWDKYSWQIDKRPTGSRWMWRDNNGDGQVQATEFTTYDLGYPYIKGLDIDKDGNVSIAGRTLCYFPANGLDSNGVPNYSASTVVKSSAPFTNGGGDMTRMKYVDETDIMYFGTGTGYPFFSEIVRFKNWKKGGRVAETLNIGDNLITFTADDKYIYVIRSVKGLYTNSAAEVDVFDAETLMPIGYILPGAEVFGESGMIDLAYGIQVSKLPNGERILIVEEDAKGKNIIYKFSEIVEVVPTDVSVSHATLNMNRYASSQLTAILTPEDVSNKTVLWSSSNTSIATVSSTGLVTALAPGNVTITATTQSGNLTATCNVTISDLSYTALSGTAYRWSGNTTSISNSNRVAEPRLNDGDIVTDIDLGGGKETVSSVYEAAGLIFVVPTNINKVDFINGTFAGLVNGVWDDGSFEADFKIQTSTNGTTWRNVNTWTLFPEYPYLSTSVSGATYTFIGNATNILGIRVTGRVRNSETSGSWQARAREITAFSTLNTGVSDIKENEILLYPNPLSKGSLSIKLPEGATQLSILDITGKMVYQQKVTRSEYLIDLSEFKSGGVYFVNVMTSDSSMNKKVIVIK
jgi:hypothetical protein